jgi:DNA-binding transcriptional regulator YbjK
MLDICQDCEMSTATTKSKSEITKIKTTRFQILESCVKVISKEGVDSVTHRRVAQEADLSGGVVSYHFNTREELINETFKFHLEQLEVMGEATSENHTQTLTGFMKSVVAFVKRDQDSPHLVTADYEMILYAARHKDLAILIKNWEDKLAKNMARELKVMGLSNSVRYAQAVINLVRGYELECLMNPSLEIDELKRRLRLLFAGAHKKKLGIAQNSL